MRCQQPRPQGSRALPELLLWPRLTLALACVPRELSHNHIEELPGLHRCQKLEEM